MRSARNKIDQKPINLTDGTERRFVGGALRESEEIYRTLFNSIDEGFSIIELIFDENGKVVDYWHREDNPVFERMTGIKNAVGKRMSELLPYVEPEWHQMIENIYYTGEPIRGEYSVQELGQWFSFYMSRIGDEGSPLIACIYDDITARKRREEQLLKELQDTKQLQQISNHIIQEDNIHVFYDILLDSAMKLMSADFASIQLMIPERQELQLLAYKNFHPDSAKHWQYVQSGPTSSCGRALVTGERVIVSDMENPSFDMDRADYDAYKLSGILSVQSTPLVSRSGKHVGMMSTHWRRPHEPSERELGLFDIVARQVADVLERNQAEVALRQNEARSRMIIETGAVCVLFFNSDGVLIDANETFIKTTGWTKKDIASGDISWRTMTPPEWLPSCEKLVDQLRITGHIPSYEKEYFFKDGKRSWMLLAARDLGDGTIVEFATDINDRKRAEAALREAELQYRVKLEAEVRDRTAELKKSQELLKTTIDSAFSYIQVFEAIRNTKGKIIDFKWLLVNKPFIDKYGDMTGRYLLSQNPAVVHTGIFEQMKHAVETGLPQIQERFYNYEQFDGWFHQVAVKMNDGVVMTTDDITARKQAEEKVRKLEAKQQHEIVRVSMETLEEERKRISESLHNGLGQLLYGIKIALSSLSQNMQQPEFDENKRYTNRLLGDAITESRRISHELMPAILEEFGLKAAIEDICEQLRDNIDFKSYIKGYDDRLDKYLELAIYRIVQELMTNVVKHARAAKASTTVNISPQQQVVIIVADNGHGIAFPETKKPGIGLASIRSKIKLLNGQIDIRSNKSGTNVKVVIPMPKTEIENQ
jgi:PAS domain S-box-containing protein